MSNWQPIPWDPFDREIITERRQLWKHYRVDLRHWTRELYLAESREDRERMLIEQLAIADALFGTAGRSIEEARAWASETVRTGREQLKLATNFVKCGA